MYALLNLIDSAISIYIWLLIASVVLTWLVAFNVINTRNRFVYTVGDFLHRVTEPALRPIRSVMPNLGGIDISPVVLILLLYFVRDLLFEMFARYDVSHLPVSVARNREVSGLAGAHEVKEAPAVLVFTRGPKLVARFDRVADRETIAQAVQNALR